MDRWQYWLFFAFAVFAVVLPLVLIWKLLPPDTDWPKLIKEMEGYRQKSDGPLTMFLLAVAGFLPYVYQVLAQRRERIELSSGHIHRSPLPQFLQFLYPSWMLRWGEITHAELSTDKRLVSGAGGMVLTLAAIGIKRRVRPYFWVDVDQTKFETPIQRMRRESKVSPEEMVAWVKRSPIFRFTQQHISDLDWVR